MFDGDPRNLKIYLSIISLLYILTFTTVSDAALNAVSYSSYILELYKQLRNTESPSVSEQATIEPEIRKNICDEIVLSGFFHTACFTPVDIEKAYSDLNQQPQCAPIFHQMYQPEASDDGQTSNPKYKYVNPYIVRKYENIEDEREFKIRNLNDFEEHLFVCTLQDVFTGAIVPMYVSKEYNVGSSSTVGSPSTQVYKPGRFVFMKLVARTIKFETLLAEEPANVYMDGNPDFNVEYYYLHIRRQITDAPAENNASDPLCNLVSRNAKDPWNQHFRFCVAVGRSSAFRDKFKYPVLAPYSCTLEKISFKDDTIDKPYYERMTLCKFSYSEAQYGEGDALVYISRAYRSNELLVYIRNPLDHKIYLENVSTNVSIVDERNSFSFVEKKK